MLQLHSDSKLARVKGPVFTRKRVHGESTANLSTHRALSAYLGHTSHQAQVMPTHSKDMVQMG